MNPATPAGSGYQGEILPKDTKPCCVCGKGLLDAIPNNWETMQPYGGGKIVLSFCYGSLKFDKTVGVTSYIGVICDECAEKFVPRLQEKFSG
jgi:hypothetical protein